ncbi:YrrC family ATP-dependent DNA helicase [Geomesophilobacter sediminis]|uniref:ATP-dependent RecD2 DNA helicase OB-fold domain-containing protein n=1 Tax=Geomesophilobacter sediminis TaxID=2798584 RepID=A0A8J7J6V2_9BACT|nr:hypothetical protein [Geomesophilobacter sediminis]MBJ6724646.1 hypothetical protein [Geomesophilobacter sediminis]
MLGIQAHVTGSVERIVYQSRQSGLSILHVRVLGSEELITVIGSAETLSVGECIEGRGFWQKRVVHEDMLFNCHQLKRLSLPLNN